jgi:hypothetical protein
VDIFLEHKLTNHYLMRYISLANFTLIYSKAKTTPNSMLVSGLCLFNLMVRVRCGYNSAIKLSSFRGISLPILPKNSANWQLVKQSKKAKKNARKCKGCEFNDLGWCGLYKK